MKLRIMKFEQPAGEFYLTVMGADVLIEMSKAQPRAFDDNKLRSSEGIQREPSSKRIKEISEYAQTLDAAFPTPILLALKDGEYDIDDTSDSIDIKDNVVAEIVDGQHRIQGIKESGRAKDFKIPVVLIPSPTVEQKALIFAIINGKQTKVPASLVYDLFGITKGRSPYKTAHEIARAMNSTPGSPWYRRLKMLGRNTGGENQSLSQGTFVKHLLVHISDNPDEDRDIIAKMGKLPVRQKCIFNDYFREDKDEIILKILLNMFNAAKKVWPIEWDNPNQYILTKTTGFIAMMKALPYIYNSGKQNNDISEEHFEKTFENAKKNIEKENKKLISDHFNPGSVGENRLAGILTGEQVDNF